MLKVKGRKPAVRGDAAIGLALILFCSYFLAKTASLRAPMDDVPGPALFPTLILIGLLMVGAWLLLTNFPFRGKTAPSKPADAAADTLLPVLGMLATIALYVLALRAIPFLIATPLLVAVGGLITLRFRLGHGQLAVLAAVSILGSLLVYLVFIRGLGIRL